MLSENFFLPQSRIRNKKSRNIKKYNLYDKLDKIHVLKKYYNRNYEKNISRWIEEYE